MARRSTLRNWAEFLPAWAVFQLLAWLPGRLALRLSEGLATAVLPLTRRWVSVAESNLVLAFPDWSPERRSATIRGCYRNLGRVLWALARAPRLNPANVDDWIGYQGFEHYQRALEQGRGVLFLTAHLGCWELSSNAHALFGNPMTVLVRPLDNPLLDGLVQRRRTLHGNRSLVKQASAKEILQALRTNKPVGILADQNAAGDDGVFVDFFGVPAAATKGVAQLAMRTGAAVIPGFAFWNPSQRRFVLQFDPPLSLRDTGDRDADVLENTQRCQAAIEKSIRAHPDQWLWIHRRWKRRPPGEPPVY